jgi:hypothetical protein
MRRTLLNDLFQEITMALPIHLALVADGVNIPSSELPRVSAALSKQVERDFQPLWVVNATVDAFDSLEDVPTDYWPIIITHVPQGGGYHEDQNGQPYALVDFDDQWSLTASHECLEMLADPFGRRLQAADLLEQAVRLGEAPSRVNYLVEVCDPCEAGQFSYQVNGQFSSNVPHLVNLSKQTNFEKLRGTMSLRAAVDMVTTKDHPPYKAGIAQATLTAAHVGPDTMASACTARALALRQAIGEIVGPPKAGKPTRGKRKRR